MNPGYDSRPSVPAATPKSEAVRLRMLDMTCSVGEVGGGGGGLGGRRLLGCCVGDWLRQGG
jgi:hypothetical protein